ERLAERCVGRLRASGHSGRTIVLKVRRFDFSTLTRSETLRGPTDDPGVVREAAGRLLEAVDTTGGVRLLGVGVSGLADYTQEDLFAQAEAEAAAALVVGGEAGAGAGAEAGAEGAAASAGASAGASVAGAEGAATAAGTGAPAVVAGEPAAPEPVERRWAPGHDVRHAVYGAGWVQGSGVGRVTVRFEEPTSGPGRVRTFAVDDPELEPGEALPLVGRG
ncbi:DinB/UmuC family translesion DNA polymerase, partial [Streptomyces massasporeus]